MNKDSHRFNAVDRWLTGQRGLSKARRDRWNVRIGVKCTSSCTWQFRRPSSCFISFDGAMGIYRSGFAVFAARAKSESLKHWQLLSFNVTPMGIYNRNPPTAVHCNLMTAGYQ